MAITATTAEFLAEARGGGADFGRTLTIGRQALFAGPLTLAAILRRNGLWPAGESRRAFMRRFADGPPWFADPYLRLLGAREVTALDASDYEGAEIVHDLNEPVPAELERRFDLVLDGGSLEHVFDLPTALRSYMRMVRPGGRLIVATMANNHCGHGFYQLSPELFFRALSEPNGYRVERLHLAGEELDFSRPVAGVSFLYDVGGGGRFAPADPEAVRERVLLRGRAGTVLLVEARRTADVEPLVQPPQQSDYEPLWARPGSAAGPVPDSEAGRLRRAFRRAVPPQARMAIALDLGPRLVPLLDPLHRLRTARRRSVRNGRHFRRR
ncbi:MAG TPA: methyltransferase domain-containing protein [Thermoleophilaceae bacterium]|nr:methyltransferase domain-containing protein [Thermoleophilaceae bacterium]